MIDGTYIKLGGDFHRVDTSLGFWVASSETPLEQVAEGDLVGVWEDSDGKLWIDHTHYFTDLDSALEFARNHRQLAIWDNQNAAAIDTRETVTT